MIKKTEPPKLDGSQSIGRPEPLIVGLADTGEAKSMTLPLLAETVSVSKRRVRTGSVKISTVTQTYEEVAELLLSQQVIDVKRVPLDQVVGEPPQVRTEGDTTIIPVLEERLVVTKQLVLKEELHIRRKVMEQTVRQPVSLRRQRAVIDRSEPSRSETGTTPADASTTKS